ncbi:MAG: hypothetical protein AVDCRST_MAG49-4557, partial [uncultured Thermomicrobiales bacterium]
GHRPPGGAVRGLSARGTGVLRGAPGRQHEGVLGGAPPRLGGRGSPPDARPHRGAGGRVRPLPCVPSLPRRALLQGQGALQGPPRRRRGATGRHRALRPPLGRGPARGDGALCDGRRPARAIPGGRRRRPARDRARADHRAVGGRRAGGGPGRRGPAQDGPPRLPGGPPADRPAAREGAGGDPTLRRAGVVAHAGGRRPPRDLLARGGAPQRMARRPRRAERRPGRTARAPPGL